MSAITVPHYPTDLPEEDGVPLESDWHRLAMTLLIELVRLHLRGRSDYFVGGNMFIYFDPSQARNQNLLGPDFFLVWDTSLNPPRKYWAVWDEAGKFPDVIIELSSPSTADEDAGTKKRIYERVFKTGEYFIYDPAEEKLKGWRLDSKQRYRKIQPNDQGWLWCEQLGLFLGTWKGEYQEKKEVYLRFFDKDGNMIASADEREELERLQKQREKERADHEKQRAENEKQRADDEKQRADTEKQRADTEKQHARDEKQRADAAEAELARLRAQLKRSED